MKELLKKLKANELPITEDLICNLKQFLVLVGNYLSLDEREDLSLSILNTDEIKKFAKKLKD